MSSKKKALFGRTASGPLFPIFELVPGTANFGSTVIQDAGSLTWEGEGILFLGAPARIYKSTANGLSWSALNTGATVGSNLIGNTDGVVMIGGSSATARRSTNFGSTWATVTLPSGNGNIMASNGAQIFTSISGSMFNALRSTNAGQTWSNGDMPPTRPGSTTASSYTHCNWLPNAGAFLAGGPGGAFTRSNNGAAWSNAGGTTSTSSAVVATSYSEFYRMAYRLFGGVLQRSPTGLAYTNYGTSPAGAGYARRFHCFGRHMFLMRYQGDNAVSYSGDGGLTWSAVATTGDATGFAAIGNTLFMHTTAGIYMTILPD